MAPIIKNNKLALSLLIAILICTALVYVLGLPGGFYFDDYPNIVQNPALDLQDLSWEELRRAAFSSDAGPFRRPVAMFSFAINHYFSGTNPLGYKIINLVIHVINTGLVFVFSLLLARLVSRKELISTTNFTNWLIALFSAAFWGLHPVNLTNVLYVVQRMNSLAGTFSLLALIGYLYARPHLSKSLQWAVLLITLFSLFGLLAIFSKENACLLPVFALLIEYAFFMNPSNTPRYWQVARQSALLILGLVTCWWLIDHLLLTNWPIEAYLPRSFTMKERLLTEGRVLWQYWGFILIPDISKMGLYLDDFVLSKNIITPISTIPALLGHIILITISLSQLKRYPVASLGILWFYIGHTLESTIFPLEIMYEHRNYFPMIGPVFAISYYCVLGATKASKKLKWVILPSCAIFLALLGTSTAIRSSQFGDAWGFPFFEAEHHPYSTRANFFAGRICGELMSKYPEKKLQYFDCANKYLRRSIQVNRYVTEPLIALAQIHVNGQYRIPKSIIDELANRLKNESLGNDGSYLAKGLLELGFADNQFIDDETINSLFIAAISNPSLVSTNKSHFLVSHGIFLCEVLEKCDEAIKQFELASIESASPQFLIVLATYQLRMGKINELQKTIKLAESRDRLGYYKENIKSLKQHRMLSIQP
jgi:protein O-mannosyl-transferase